MVNIKNQMQQYIMLGNFLSINHQELLEISVSCHVCFKLPTIFFLLAECFESESDPEEIEVGN